MKRKIRLIVDIGMIALLPLLMVYSLIGENWHEIAGSAMFVLFIVHHVLNAKWFKTIFKGKYNLGKMSLATLNDGASPLLNAKRIFTLVLNLLLFAFMLLQIASGILLSRHLFSFISIEGTAATAREIHLCLSFWGLILMSLHLGTHLNAPLNLIKRKSKAAFWTVSACSFAAAAYGIYNFAYLKIFDYITLKSSFMFIDFSASVFTYIIRYLSIIILFAAAGYFIFKFLPSSKKRKK